MRRLNLSVALFAACALLALNASAETIGNGLNHTSTIDGCTDCSYILGQPFTIAGETVQSYTFNSGSTDGAIVPYLYTGVNNGDGTTTFTVTGIGSYVNVTSTGIQTDSFGLTSGSAVTGASTYFGFTNYNDSNVLYDYDGSGPGTFLYVGDFAVGDSFTFQNTSQDMDSQNDYDNRLYSIDATADTPEPGSLSLLGTGLLAVGGLVRRRFKK